MVKQITLYCSASNVNCPDEWKVGTYIQCTAHLCLSWLLWTSTHFPLGKRPIQSFPVRDCDFCRSDRPSRPSEIKERALIEMYTKVYETTKEEAWGCTTCDVVGHHKRSAQIDR